MRKANPNAVSMADSLNQCLIVLNSLNSDMKELKQQHSELITTIASQKCTISTLQEETARLSSDLETANRKLQVFCTPPPARAQREHIIATPVHTDFNTTDQESATDERSPKRQRSAGVLEPSGSEILAETPQGGAQVPHVPPRQLRFTGDANTPDSKKTRFADILVWLSKGGRLDPADLKASSIPSSSNKFYFVNCLELAQVVISKEEQTALTCKTSSHEKRIEAAFSVEAKCCEKMLQYEGVDPELEKKNHKSWKKATVCGLGGWVQMYRKWIIKNSADPGRKPKDQTLIDRAKVQPNIPGTPPGNTSIWYHFGMSHLGQTTASTAASASSMNTATTTTAVRRTHTTHTTTSNTTHCNTTATTHTTKNGKIVGHCCIIGCTCSELELNHRCYRCRAVVHNLCAQDNHLCDDENEVILYCSTKCKQT